MVHRVRIFSPGSFFTEQNVFEIPEWNVDQAIELSRTVVQRHGAGHLVSALRPMMVELS